MDLLVSSMCGSVAKFYVWICWSVLGVSMLVTGISNPWSVIGVKLSVVTCGRWSNCWSVIKLRMSLLINICGSSNNNYCHSAKISLFHAVFFSQLKRTAQISHS